MSIENGLVGLLFLMLLALSYFIIIPLIKIIIEEYLEEKYPKSEPESKQYIYLNNLTFQLVVFDELHKTDSTSLYELIGEL